MEQPRVNVKAVFDEALEIESLVERKAYLDKACATSPELRQKVEALLQAYADAGSFLQNPALAPAATVDSSPGEGANATPRAEAVGSRIGPYKLLQQIGEGGMGTVWMAEQQEPVRRLVALKVIKAGMDSAQVIARFEAERQALALMDHPHIAKVFDGGTTASGRPYFVIELVKGIPITKYCDEHRLTPRQRLELFVPVCQALQHAHQKGIIHRDVKPSNVLVAPYDGKPVVKVIDFGVAKAAGQRLTERTLFTEFGAVVGTLEYMSPEQAELNNQDIDTRSDLYSLGVLLYELLTGTTPLTKQRLQQLAFTEMLRLIREEEPPKPSTRLSDSKDSLPSISAQRQTEPAKLTKLVRGELDWIVMKALEKDRTRRYETANGLARDVERYLHDEPVEACPPSAGYRLRKYLRRHHAPVLAAVVVLLALVGGTVGMTIGLVQARQAEAHARAERDKALRAEAAANEQRDQKAAAEQATRQEADKAKAISKFLTEDLLVQAQPEMNAPLDRVTLLEVVDRAAAQVGERFANQPLLEAEIRKTLGQVYYGLRKLDQAERHLRAALATQHRLLGDENLETYRTMTALGCVVLNLDRIEESFGLLRASEAGLSAAQGADHPDTLIAKTHLICVYAADDRIGEALPLCEETLRLAKARLGMDHRDTWDSMLNLAMAYRATRRVREGLALNEQALELARAKLGADNPGLVHLMHHLARAYLDARQPHAAMRLCGEALRISRTKLGPDNSWTLESMVFLGEAYRNARWLEEAVALFKETYQLAKAKLGPDHPCTLRSMTGLAGAYRLSGWLEEAVALREEALRLARRGKDHGFTLQVMDELAVTYQQAGQRAKVLPLREEAFQLAQAKLRPDHSRTLQTLNSLATAYERAGQLDRVESLLRDVLDRRRGKKGLESVETATALANLGQNLLKQQKYAEAEPVLRDGLSIRTKEMPNNWVTSSTKSALGGALLGQKKYAEAEPLLVQGYEGMKHLEAKLPPQGKPRLTEALERLVQFYDAWGKPDEAARWRKQLEAARAGEKK